ncbi:MAG TPA: hypothetical protein PLA43_07865 [Bryobacteraceae bacterium]|nr:hypothetical protein [Bryobacteraceae bacterium]HOQ44647.1 hypothetical protein [Bryobacteraceae bacterium]HPU71857.1 hypothetical protein [Bryobacteraceae bacterium]
MSTQAELSKISVQDFAQRFSQEMIPLNNRFSYFSAVPLGEEEVKEFLQDPISALPPNIQNAFAHVYVFLVPYLEKGIGKRNEVVTFEKPDERNQVWSAHFMSGADAIFVFAVKDTTAADYHYTFYRAFATMIAEELSIESLERYPELLREELRIRVHGEVDEESWQLKQSLLQRQSDVRRDTKLFRNYARQSLVDTLTLYLHGICCDIDVETGPRQIPSRYLRKRLEFLQEVFPPPSGYAVFPEDLQQ